MRTLVAPCSFEESIKRSRFVTHAAPAKSQAETLEFYEAVADPSATHNCWAWSVDGVYRFNDDGEPGGTAGRPILSVIEGRALDQVMVVVTRYFGGIKLGVGGLVRAYSGGAAKCLDGGRLVTLQKRLQCSLEADFAMADSVHRLLDRFEAEKLNESWAGEGLEMQLEVNESEFGALRDALSEVSRGAINLRRLAS